MPICVSSSGSGRHQAILITLGFALVFLALTAPGIYSVDGNTMLVVSESLVTHRGFTVPETMGHPGVGGRFYSHWYPLLSIVAAPSAYLALTMSRMAHVPFHYLGAILALPIIGFLTAASAGIVGLMARRLGASGGGAWIAAVSFCLGTVALAYGRTFFAEPLLAFLTVAAVYFTFDLSLEGILLGATLAALAILAKPTGIVVGPILAGYLFCKNVPMRRTILPAIGTAIGLGVFALFNLLRFGNPLNFGIPSPFHISNAVPAALGLLVGPGYGLVWFCPPVILAAIGFRKALKIFRFEALAIAAVFIGFLVLHACWREWSGGWSWGPRYLVPILPLLCALTGLLEKQLRGALIALTFCGFLVNVPTTFSFYERYYAELTEEKVPTDAALAWSLRHAPWWNEWPAAIRQVRDAERSDVREIFAQRGAPAGAIAESRALRVVAIWWWVLPIVHIPRVIGAVFSIMVLASGAWIVYRAKPVRDAGVDVDNDNLARRQRAESPDAILSRNT